MMSEKFLFLSLAFLGLDSHGTIASKFGLNPPTIDSSWIKMSNCKEPKEKLDYFWNSKSGDLDSIIGSPGFSASWKSGRTNYLRRIDPSGTLIKERITWIGNEINPTTIIRTRIDKSGRRVGEVRISSGNVIDSCIVTTKGAGDYVEDCIYPKSGKRFQKVGKLDTKNRQVYFKDMRISKTSTSWIYGASDSAIAEIVRDSVAGEFPMFIRFLSKDSRISTHVQYAWNTTKNPNDILISYLDSIGRPVRQFEVQDTTRRDQGVLSDFALVECTQWKYSAAGKPIQKTVYHNPRR